MTVDFVLEYIPRKMKELGHGDNYHIRWRRLRFAVGQQMEIDATNEIYIFLYEPNFFKISSINGEFNYSSPLMNEQVFEHTGKIQITNLDENKGSLNAIQIIPIKNR